MSFRLDITAPRSDLWITQSPPFHRVLGQKLVLLTLMRRATAQPDDTPGLRVTSMDPQILAQSAGFESQSVAQWETALGKLCHRYAPSKAAFIKLDDSKMDTLSAAIAKKMQQFGLADAGDAATKDIDLIKNDMVMLQNAFRYREEQRQR